MIEIMEFPLGPFRKGAHIITGQVLAKLPTLPQKGLLNLFVKHTSAGITLNENADPSVRVDFMRSLDLLVKENEPFYTHVAEGADDMPAHIKTSLIGSQITIPIVNGRLCLGTWQGIYLCEFRNHASARTIIATIYS